MISEHSKDGKINAVALRALFKVVIDDTYYEISGVEDYIVYLKQQVKRLQTIQKYAQKADNAKKDKDKDYYHEGMRLLFAHGETFQNYQTVLAEYQEAIQKREEHRQKLYDEIKIIKKLRV